MIRFKQYLIIFSVIPFISACEKQPELFKETPGLYFGVAEGQLSYSFAKYPKKLLDTIYVPVSILGDAAGTDRAISIGLVKADDMDGVEGQHFKLPEQAVMPANAYKTVVPVAVYRTADLENKPVKFKLKVNQSDSFPGLGITNQQTVIVNLAYMQQPANWGTLTGAFFAGYSTNFGTWTKTKYKVILDALYDEEKGETITEFPGTRSQPPVIYSQYLSIVRNYIRVNYPGNYGGVGAKLLDPDANNQPVQVGPANY